MKFSFKDFFGEYDHICRKLKKFTEEILTRKLNFCAVLSVHSNTIQLFMAYNHFHNIFKLFDVLLNFAFTTSETMGDCYYKHSIYELPHELPSDLKLKE